MVIIPLLIKMMYNNVQCRTGIENKPAQLCGKNKKQYRPTKIQMSGTWAMFSYLMAVGLEKTANGMPVLPIKKLFRFLVNFSSGSPVGNLGCFHVGVS